MRDIKFRGKIKDKEKWVQGTLLIIPAPPQCIGEKKPDAYFIQFANPNYIPDWNMPYSMVQAEVILETVGQYTGLKDKNGKEIYEGDIFNLGDNRILYIVEWFDTGLKGRQNGNNSRVQYWQTEIEVIGNIYENKELLKEKE